MLGNHATHAHPADMKAFDVQGIHQPQAIFSHVVEAIGCGHRQAEFVTQHLVGQVGAGRCLAPTAQADVAVVVADHPKALLAQGNQHFIGPVDQLATEAHDQ
ncbi:hypothetical protein D3C75_1181430 [compost metagenome]